MLVAMARSSVWSSTLSSLNSDTGKWGTITFLAQRHADPEPHLPRLRELYVEDLKEERDALQRDVFPKLRSLCE
jgi:hypothetical protein